MKPSPKKSERGIALLMVLIALTVLGSMTADLMETNEVYLATAVNARDAKQAEYMAKSGVNLARLVLTFKDILGNTPLPFWEFSDMLINTVTSSHGGFLGDFTGADLSGAKGLGLKGIGDDGNLEVNIVDEESKININLTNSVTGPGSDKIATQLALLMDSPDYDDLFNNELATNALSTREDIICEMIDWSDSNEDLCDGSGSEDRSLYASLIPPYERKNAPFDSLDELHLVSGVNDDFWSAFVDPNPEDPKSRIMTIWGKGKININTASLLVLFPIVCDLATDESGISPCLDETQKLTILQLLNAFIFFRKLMPVASPNKFFQAIENPATMFMPDIPGLPLVPAKKRLLSRAFTTQSTVFSIYASGIVGRVSKRIHVVVDMSSETQIAMPEEASLTLAGGKVLYYRME